MTIKTELPKVEYIKPSFPSVSKPSIQIKPITLKMETLGSDLPSYSGTVESIDNFKHFGEKFSVKAQDDTLNAADKVYDSYVKLVQKYPNAKNIKFPAQPNPADFAENKAGYKSYKKQLKIWKNNCLDLIKMQEKNVKEGRLPRMQIVEAQEPAQKSLSVIKDVNIVIHGDVTNSNIIVGSNNVAYTTNTNNGAVTNVDNKPTGNSLLVENKTVKAVESKIENEKPVTEPQSEKSKSEYTVKQGDYWYKIVSEQYNISNGNDINAIVRQLKNEYYQSHKESLNKKGITSSRGNFMSPVGSNIEMPVTVEVNGRTYKIKK